VKRISVIIGSRPQAVKLAPVILACQHHRGIKASVCVTTRRSEVVRQVLDVFGITPDADLGLKVADRSLPALTARAIEAMDEYLGDARPDFVFVQSDTATTFCAALASFYRGVPVGQVEAGLRAGDTMAAFPEESFRILTSRLATLHFAPTEHARTNLLREYVTPGRVFVTGNTAVDALMTALEQVRKAPPALPGLPRGALKSWGDAPLVLITSHGREGFGRAFESVCKAVVELARRFDFARFVWAVHLNPAMRRPADRYFGNDGPENVHLVEPLPYLSFIALLERATLVLTDSAAIQEEAPELGKPVLLMRQLTDRPEGIAAGTTKLVGTDTRTIVREAARLLDDPDAYQAMASVPNPYGDGKASERIFEATLAFLS
jgi:UDP-N-acetylglucosamine 2-epimerase (non-hydrolysing)